MKEKKSLYNKILKNNGKLNYLPIYLYINFHLMIITLHIIFEIILLCLGYKVVTFN